MSPEPNELEQSLSSDRSGEAEAIPVGDAASTAWLTDESEQRLHPNFIACERLVGWIVVGVLVLAVIVGVGLCLWMVDLSSMLQGLIGALALAVVGGLSWSAQCWPAIDYRYRSFRVSDTGIQILEGVLWRSVMDVPKSRVQHTDVNQGPIERKYGLAHVVIHTAGTSSASVKLEGLARETAVALRNHLVGSDSDDAV